MATGATEYHIDSAVWRYHVGVVGELQKELGYEETWALVGGVLRAVRALYTKFVRDRTHVA